MTCTMRVFGPVTLKCVCRVLCFLIGISFLGWSLLRDRHGDTLVAAMFNPSDVKYGPGDMTGELADFKVALGHPEHSGAMSPGQNNHSSNMSNANEEPLLDAAARVVTADRIILLAGADAAFADMAINFYLSSLLPHNIQNYLFACNDKRCCDLLHAYNITCHVYIGAHKLTSEKASAYGSKDFLAKMNVRTDMILTLIQNGFNVLHSDTDVFFKHNPFLHLNCTLQTHCDLMSLMDSSDYNAGFIYLRPTQENIRVYKTMKSMLKRRPRMDDQDQLTRSIRLVSKKNKAFKAVKLPTNKFLCGLYYFEKGQRAFVDDNPCDECIVIHNNWIVTKEAKIYRFKEHGMWQYDDNLYYSSKTRKYIMFENPPIANSEWINNSEIGSLTNALAIGQILNRTVILPKFHLVTKGGDYKHISLEHRFKIALFDRHFGDIYREYTFLMHPKVPACVKTSISSPCSITSDKVETECSYTPKNTTHGANDREIINWFGNRTDSVLKFTSLYSSFSGFLDARTEQIFREKIALALIKSNQRQYGK